MNHPSLTATRTLGRMIAGILDWRMVAGTLFIIGMTAGGCADKGRIPSGILSREKMEDVLWDMIQADQYATLMTKDSAHTDLKLERLRLYQQVFLLHGVSRAEFQKSYNYYMAHPELTQTLFDSLAIKSTRLRSEAYSHPSFRPTVPVPTPKSLVPVGAPRPDTMHRSLRHPSLMPLLHPPAGNPAARPSAGNPKTKPSAANPGTKQPAP